MAWSETMLIIQHFYNAFNVDKRLDTVEHKMPIFAQYDQDTNGPKPGTGNFYLDPNQEEIKFSDGTLWFVMERGGISVTGIKKFTLTNLETNEGIWEDDVYFRDIVSNQYKVYIAPIESEIDGGIVYASNIDVDNVELIDKEKIIWFVTGTTLLEPDKPKIIGCFPQANFNTINIDSTSTPDTQFKLCGAKSIYIPFEINLYSEAETIPEEDHEGAFAVPLNNFIKASTDGFELAGLKWYLIERNSNNSKNAIKGYYKYEYRENLSSEPQFWTDTFVIIGNAPTVNVYQGNVSSPITYGEGDFPQIDNNHIKNIDYDIRVISSEYGKAAYLHSIAFLTDKEEYVPINIYNSPEQNDPTLYEGRELSEFTWAQLSEKCKKGDFSYLRVGDYKTITLTDGQVLQMQIGGINTYYNSWHGSYQLKNHIDWISKECLKDGIVWSELPNNNGTADQAAPYLLSKIYSYLNGTVYDLLPQELKNIIVDTYKFIEIRYSSSGILTNSNSIGLRNLGKLWIPTELEVLGSIIKGTENISGSYGIQYPIFAYSNKNRVKQDTEGNYTIWWFSTVSQNNSVTATGMHINGYASGALIDSTTDRKVPLCFRIA